MIMEITTGLLILCVAGRIIMAIHEWKIPADDYVLCQTNGGKERQSDVGGAKRKEYGKMAVLADGIGKENTGFVSADIAVKGFLEMFETYDSLQKPEYFFKSTFAFVHARIQRTIEERRGGASVAAVYIDNEKLWFALVGDVKIALVRNKEIISLSKGQTIDVLAEEAYKKGKLSRQEAVWSSGETCLWSYVGMDGFREIELSQQPIRVKTGDLVMLMTKGIYEEISWAEIEEIVAKENSSIQVKAERIISKVEEKRNPDRENGSVLILEMDR